MFPTIEELEMPDIVDFFKKKKDKRKEKDVESEKEQAEVAEQHELLDLSFLKKLAIEKRKKRADSIKLSR